MPAISELSPSAQEMVKSLVDGVAPELLLESIGDLYEEKYGKSPSSIIATAIVGLTIGWAGICERHLPGSPRYKQKEASKGTIGERVVKHPRRQQVLDHCLEKWDYTRLGNLVDEIINTELCDRMVEMITKKGGV